MHLKRDNNVPSHLCLQLYFLCLSGQGVLPSIRSPWEYFCSLTQVSGISLGYPSPSCCNSSPSSFPTAFSYLAAASLPPVCLLFHRCWVQTCVAEGLPVVSAMAVHLQRSRGVVLVRMGVSVLQHQKILLASAAAAVAVSRTPISQAWRCLPFHTAAGVPARLSACRVTSRFTCQCLATSVPCCHLPAVPGVSWALCSCGACAGMLLPRVPPLGRDTR